MIRHAGLAVGIALALLPVHATASEDARIRTLFYDPAAIVPIHGRSGIQSTIEFAPDERIENIAIGDSSAWQVTPNRRANLLFLKPVLPHAHTNMTVVTDRRTYMFDLASAAPRATPLYILRFTYPAPPPRIGEEDSSGEMDDQGGEEPMLMPVAARPIDLNFAWEGKGAHRLLPERSFDDGQSTYLAWPADEELPAILATGPDGNEGPVNYAIKGAYVVIDGVPARLTLRAGKDSATLTNRRPASAGPLTPPIQTARK